jgi:hypothetical protein
MLGCRLFGHRYRFSAQGTEMSWSCARGCAEGGSKSYSSPEQARRYATAFDREDRNDLGRRAPLVAGLPLRIVRAWRSAAAQGTGSSTGGDRRPAGPAGG